MELIKINNDGKITARELYEFLYSDLNNFTRWSKTNIENDDFYTEGVDWQGYFIMKNGNEAREYSLTIDFAKHLCMLSRTERGKEARNYFVECEKRSTKPMCMEDMMIAQLQSMKEVRLQIEQNAAGLIDANNNIKRLESKITTIPTEYFTIAGYASLRGVKVDISKANLLGRRGAKLSRQHGIDIGKVSDSKFGQVNTYHLDILKELFA